MDREKNIESKLVPEFPKNIFSNTLYKKFITMLKIPKI